MEINQINTVLFDLDGTLLDTIVGITASINATLDKWNCPRRTVAEVRDFVGNGLRRTLSLAIPGGEQFPGFEDALAYLLRHYEDNCMEATKPYPGIQSMLQALKNAGYKLGIISNKTDPAVQTLAQRFFPDLIDAAVGEKPGNRRKPAPDGVLEAMARLGSKPENCIYVGDSEVDLLTAENSGLGCISVLWGFRDKAALYKAGATCFVAKPGEILPLLQEKQQP